MHNLKFAITLFGLLSGSPPRNGEGFAISTQWRDVRMGGIDYNRKRHMLLGVLTKKKNL